MGNELGIVGMSGNVWEWCADWYGDYPEGSVTDPKGPASGDYHVLRGGSGGCDARLCRSAYRFRDVPGNRNSGIGFRLCCSAGPRGEAEPGGRVTETPPKRSGRRPARAGAHEKVQLWGGRATSEKVADAAAAIANEEDDKARQAKDSIDENTIKDLK